MRHSWTGGERPAPADIGPRDPHIAAALPRELRIAALIANAPQFPMEDIAEELILKMQGGLRGFVRDADLN